MKKRVCFVSILVLAGTVLASFLMAGATQTSGDGPKSQTYKGLEITVKSLERGRSVSLQDCPPGENSVRGVIRPSEDNEFATVQMDVKVLDSFEPVRLEKPMLHDEGGTGYKTAQSFTDLNEKPSYTCNFSFRVPKGTTVTRFSIEEASFDITSLAK